jgi:hypothetical protein
MDVTKEKVRKFAIGLLEAAKKMRGGPQMHE